MTPPRCSAARSIPNEVVEWELYVPRDYDPGSPAGLLVFISPTDSGKMPRRYQSVLDEKNLIWIGANFSGSRVRVARRVSLALLGDRTCGPQLRDRRLAPTMGSDHYKLLI